MGAMRKWKEFGLESDRMAIVLQDIILFQKQYEICPTSKDIFNIFRMIYPDDVRVVIIGQSPYPNKCTITNVSYACGPAFLPHPKCVTTPVTLRSIIAEVQRDMSTQLTQTPHELLLSWIQQGVLLLNASLTCGINCPEYLMDHSISWIEVMTDIITLISKIINPIFLLVGQQAWKFESCILSPYIKVSHPVSRVETSTPWNNSSVFSQISNMMLERGEVPIKWI